MVVNESMKQIMILLLLSFSALAQDKKNVKGKVEEKTEQVAAQKSKLDSLLKGTPFSVDAGASMNAGATVGGKAVKPADAVKFFTETLPDLGLKIKEVRKKERQRRQKQKKYHTEYADLAIVKRVTSSGGGDRLVQEEFHVLKEYQQPSGYVPEIYWYDSDSRAISKSVIKDKEQVEILHGPYKRYVADELVAEGCYYMGAKDGRWTQYDANFILLDKTHWSKGFPSESIIAYYDSAHTKIREVIPVQFGKRKGEYRRFYEAGQMMEKGQYDNDIPIGTWQEFYQFKPQQKKTTRYAARWYDDDEPVVLKEWDKSGKVIYELPKEKATTDND